MRAFEAVPNFSEGRDRDLLAALAAGPAVLDVHADPDHNRAVITMAGTNLDRLGDQVFAAVAIAVERIDMRRHTGLHPRVGAADVVPLVPLGDASIEEVAGAARGLGDRIWSELGVPVWFYGHGFPGRRLADIRAGRALPDLGRSPHPTAGVTCVGARPVLVAYNVTFEGLAVARAREIAVEMRRLPGVQALAFELAGGQAQVSMNLTRPAETTAAMAYERACTLAGQAGRAELVGLCPAAAAGPGCEGRILEVRLAALLCESGPHGRARGVRGPGG
jgi:glutamate formiminotransferase